MDCRGFETEVLAFCDESLAPDRKEVFEEHFIQCKRCALLAAVLKEALRDRSLAQQARLSRRFWPRLHRRIRDYDSRKKTLKWLWVPNTGIRPIAVTAGLLLAIWAGVHLGNVYSDRLWSPTRETSLPQAEVEEEMVPYLAVLDELPHGSVAELLLQQTIGDGLEQ
jgi:hypothetical protein